MFKALRGRNYRLFFVGQGVSLIGTWMQRVALGWLVYRMTEDAMLLGLIAFLGQIPISLMAPVAGAVADRMSRRKLMIWTQVAAACQATLLASLTLSGLIEVWHIALLSVFLGSCLAFESPTRQAFVIEMTGNEDLMNAIALNSSLVNIARFLGPAAAGFLVATVGEGVVFASNAVTYIAFVVALFAMRLPAYEHEESKLGIIARIREGIGYAFGSWPIRTLLATIAATTLVSISYAVLMPIFARDVLGRGPEALGILMGANGAGALTGAVILASRKSVKGLAGVIPAALAVFGVALVSFSLSTNYYISIPLMCVSGLSFMLVIAGTNTVVQTIVPDEMRGRVMSLFILSFLGIMPFGNLLAGFSASYIGAPATVTCAGAVVIAASVFLMIRLKRLTETIHAIQVERGFIEKPPEVMINVG